MARSQAGGGPRGERDLHREGLHSPGHRYGDRLGAGQREQGVCGGGLQLVACEQQGEGDATAVCACDAHLLGREAVIDQVRDGDAHLLQEVGHERTVTGAVVFTGTQQQTATPIVEGLHHGAHPGRSIG